MGNCEEDVIDLTSSFTLIEHSNLANEVIVIDTDESFNTSAKFSPEPLRKRGRSSTDKKSRSLANESLPIRKSGGSHKFGSCPICWEELGKNPLAATKCGHVFCLKCLEKSLEQLGKKCPSCRRVLKGSSAYHPLYLNPC